MSGSSSWWRRRRVVVCRGVVVVVGVAGVGRWWVEEGRCRQPLPRFVRVWARCGGCGGSPTPPDVDRIASGANWPQSWCGCSITIRSRAQRGRARRQRLEDRPGGRTQLANATVADAALTQDKPVAMICRPSPGAPNVRRSGHGAELTLANRGTSAGLGTTIRRPAANTAAHRRHQLIEVCARLKPSRGGPQEPRPEDPLRGVTPHGFTLMTGGLFVEPSTARRGAPVVVCLPGSVVRGYLCTRMTMSVQYDGGVPSAGFCCALP